MLTSDLFIIIVQINILICFCFFRRENNKYAGAGQKSIKRATAIIGMAPDLDASSYDHTDENKYGLGKGMINKYRQ